MLVPWLRLPNARRLLDAWSERCELDLAALGTEADAAALADTAVTQPLLTANALLAMTALAADRPAPSVVAGHSVGELAALAVAGVVSPADAVALAAIRGRAMASACAVTPTAMAAVIGGDRPDVARAVAAADLDLANVNGAGQVVVAGPVERVDALVTAPPPGARVRKLQVAGAFHTSYMAQAAEQFGRAAEGVEVADPTCLLLSNLDGRVVGTGSEALRLVVAQMVRPVRWDLCMATMSRLGVESALELPPAGTLAALVGRTLRDLTVTRVRTPEDLGAPAAALAG